MPADGLTDDSMTLMKSAIFSACFKGYKILINAPRTVRIQVIWILSWYFWLNSDGAFRLCKNFFKTENANFSKILDDTSNPT